jgi:DNA polymerase-4
MSAGRTMSRQQRENRQSLDAMLISLCTRLEQRMVKNGIFCKSVSFTIRYLDGTGWDTAIQLMDPIQDGIELRKYILDKMHDFETSTGMVLFNDKLRHMLVAIHSFVSDKVLQYSLFDNRIQHDLLRKVMYNIKDKYGRNAVRKGCELIEPNVMKDAIGFGSVKDMVGSDGGVVNNYLLEEDEF